LRSTEAGHWPGGIAETSGSGRLDQADSRSQPTPRTPVIQVPRSVKFCRSAEE
jgi:hypothetical protein